MTEPLERPEDVAPGPKDRARMVGWFDPGQLFQTGLRTVVSTLFGANADRRVLDSLVQPPGDPCSFANESELWIDYVSDTGDGFNSTYGVAYHVAHPTIEVRAPDGTTHRTERGRLLVFGGDEVYPTPSRDEYKQRLVRPYRTALYESADPSPAVFAVPGNHDWYDSLVSFTRLFCTTRNRWIGGWEARQMRSYFAVELPQGWWMIGVDVQLGSDIDDPQLEYFRGVAREHMKPGDRVILCTAEPHWVYEARYEKLDPSVAESNLRILETEVFKERIAVYIAGDLHHYRRHADAAGRQKITAGGGGAYISPTHHDMGEVATLHDGYRYQSAYPSPEDSKRLSWRNLIFPFLNPKFGIVTAILYLLLGWSVKATAVGAFGLSEFWTVVGIVATSAIQSQTAVLWGILVITGFVYFTDTKSKIQKRLGGSLHAIANLVAAFLSGWAGSYVAAQYVPATSTLSLLIVAGFLLVGGYFGGAFIMGIYLLVSLNFFGRHNTEAFSSLRIEDYRSWVRMRVAPDGALHIYPLAIHTVAKKWKPGQSTRRADGEIRGLLEPDDPSATSPELIEPPVVVRPSAVAATDAVYRAAARATSLA